MRSRSAGYSSTNTSNFQSCVIMALIPGRGRFKHEVGIALIDLFYPHLILCQINDSHVYPNTLAKINVYQPEEIIVPEIHTNESRTEACLYEAITRKFEGVNVTTIPRAHFNATVGWDLLKIHSTDESSSVLELLRQKELATSAAAGLMRYIVYIQGISYAPKTVKIEFQSSNDSVVVSVESVECLELLTSLNPAFPSRNLFSVMDKCVTAVGKKLLRASMLQPLYNEKRINDRLQCVTELICNPSLLQVLQSSLRRFSGVEKLLNVAIERDSCDNILYAVKNLNDVLLVKNLINSLPVLHAAINMASSSIFRQIRHNLERNKCNEVKAFILEIIQLDAIPAKGYTSANMQRCFAIKPKVSELLDVIRQAYCELIDSMIQYVEDLSSKYSLQLTLGCSALAGYHILATSSEKLDSILSKTSGASLDKLILLDKKKRTRLLTTERLLVDSQKCREICEEIHIMSNVLVENLISKIRNYIGYFFQLCSDVSELDLLVSLAIISRSEGFVRPEFGHKLCIIDSLHPIRFLFDSESYSPNNVIASVPYNFHVITGPNLGGKTTYLQQILLLQLLAQIGCYIPAQRAEIRISDRLFFYSSMLVDSGRCMSGFAREIEKLSCILDFLTDRSLVALDEPCTTTDVEGGSCLAAAICTKILCTNAFTFCATHLRYLTRLSETFLNVTDLHFESQMTVADDWSLKYTYKLKLGASPVQHYGIDIASQTMLPKAIIERAREIADRVKYLRKESYPIEPSSELIVKRNIYSFMAKAYNLLMKKQFTASNLLNLLEKSIDDSYLNFMKERLEDIVRLENGSVPSTSLVEKSFHIVNPNQSMMLSMLSISNILCSNIQNLESPSIPESNTYGTQEAETSTCLVPTDRPKEDVTINYTSKSMGSNAEECENVEENDQNKMDVSLPSLEIGNLDTNPSHIPTNKSDVTSTPQGSEKFDVHLFYEDLLQKTLLLEINQSQESEIAAMDSQDPRQK